MPERLEQSAPISASSADRFYDIFRNHMSDLVNIFPEGFKSAEVVEGTEGSIGAVVLYTYVLVGEIITGTVRLRTEAISDEERSVTFRALEGDVLTLYPSYQFTVAVSADSAHWTIEYERASPLIPQPQIYMAFAIATTLAVDTYLRLHP